MQLICLMFHEQTVLDIHRMTICIENHFSLNKMLLLIVGLWPYHRTKLIEFHQFFFTAILTNFKFCYRIGMFISLQLYYSLFNQYIVSHL